jgi:hypothetical protein
MEITATGIELFSPKHDATIVWRKMRDSVWNMYVEPLPKNTEFEAKAERIGYADSKILRID